MRTKQAAMASHRKIHRFLSAWNSVKTPFLPNQNTVISCLRQHFGLNVCEDKLYHDTHTLKLYLKQVKLKIQEVVGLVKTRN